MGTRPKAFSSASVVHVNSKHLEILCDHQQLYMKQTTSSRQLIIFETRLTAGDQLLYVAPREAVEIAPSTVHTITQKFTIISPWSISFSRKRQKVPHHVRHRPLFNELREVRRGLPPVTPPFWLSQTAKTKLHVTCRGQLRLPDRLYSRPTAPLKMESESTIPRSSSKTCVHFRHLGCRRRLKTSLNMTIDGYYSSTRALLSCNIVWSTSAQFNNETSEPGKIACHHEICPFREFIRRRGDETTRNSITALHFT